MFELIACIVAGAVVGYFTQPALGSFFRSRVLCIITGIAGGYVGQQLGLLVGGESWMVFAPLMIGAALLLPVILFHRVKW